MRRVFLVLLLLSAPPLANAADRSVPESIALPGGPLPFTAAVETMRLTNPKGEAQAEVVVTSFVVRPQPGSPPRPVTFAFNGGPGASSAWLDMGAIGPWRVPVALVPGQDPTPVDNAETWLPFTDLVFIDPVGTGYSRALVTGEAARPFSTVDGDIDSLAVVVRRWLEAHDRLLSPKFIVGESYGGFRGPRLARTLLDAQGVGVSGLVLISPVLDFNGFGAPYNPLRWVAALPSVAAAHRRAPSRDSMADVEAYARTEFLADLLRGPRDAAALDRIASRVSALTGLPADLVRRRTGHLDTWTATHDEAAGTVASAYDLAVTVPSAAPETAFDSTPDPVLDGLRAPITSAMLATYRRLGWQPDGAPARQYEVLSNAVNRGWDYGRGFVRPQSMTALRQYLVLDPTVRVLVVHGMYDTVTPYFGTALLLDQVPETVPAGRLGLSAYPGGHMFYTQDASRAALRDDAAGLVSAVLAARAARVVAAPPAVPAAPGTPPPAATPLPAPQTPGPPATR